ncbi:hypothetical protein MMC07_006797 [Pseudocyphellaria aurata]|nr:hypothetical protein [Pseudocyphellaria aurata]
MSENTGIGPCCLSGAIHSGSPSGRVETIGGLETYVAEPASESKAKSIVFLVDIFGWELPNIRLLADEYARAGFYAYIPDIQSGDAIPLDFIQTVEPPLKVRENLSLATKAKNAAVIPTIMGPWMLKHREAVTMPLVDGFVNTVRMIPGTNKIGAIGFCWGGRYAILQAHGRSMDGEGTSIGGVDAAYACHPSMIAIPGDFEPVTKPLSIALGSKDSLTDPSSAGKIKEVLEAKKNVPHEIQIYEDQIHGFALRSDWSSEKDKKAMDDAGKQGIAWFEKYLS